MKIRKILLLGGTGFIGSTLAEQLVERGYFVTVPTRRRERAKHLLLLPTIDIVEADIHDANVLEALVQKHDCVINLIGILHGNFEREHVALPKLVAETCARVGVKRLLHMSSLAADANGPSNYLQSRGQGEQQVWNVAKNNPQLSVTVFQPSVVFGERDQFLNKFLSLVSLLPLFPLGAPKAQFQPVWVGDVARAITLSIELDATRNMTYQLVGPKVYTLQELVELVIAISGKPRAVIGLPAGLSMLQAMVLEMLPGKMITRDNLRSMRVPSTSDAPFPLIFGSAHDLESTVRGYMNSAVGRAQYVRFRRRG